MACTITILNLNITDSDDGNVSRVTINGTAEDCERINVTMKCPRSENSVPTNINEDGTWSVVIDIDSGCNCGDRFAVTATCVGDETCEATPLNDILLCPRLCPITTITKIDLGDENNCNDDGTHSVTFSVNTNNLAGANPVTLQWWFEMDGDGNVINMVPDDTHVVAAASVDDWDRTHNFPTPGSYEPLLVILSPEDCPTLELNHPIELTECPRDCPQISGIIDEIDEECHPDGRDVTFNAEIDGNGVASYYWNFGDGNESADPPPVTHRYNVLNEGRRYNVTLTIVGPTMDCVDTEVVQIEVPQCEFSDDGGGSGYTDETEGAGGGAWEGCLSVNCATLLYISIFTLVLASILAILSCFFPPLLLAAIIFGLLGFGLFGLWAWLCSATTPCRVMRRVHCFLFWMIAVVFPVIFTGAVIAAWLGVGPWCPALAAAIDWGGWGAIYAWLGWAMRKGGCEPMCG